MLSLLNSVEHQASQLDRPQHDSSIYGGMLITLALDGYQTMVGLDHQLGAPADCKEQTLSGMCM